MVLREHHSSNNSKPKNQIIKFHSQNSSNFNVIIDGKQTESIKNTHPLEFENVLVYAGDKNIKSSDALLKNLQIRTTETVTTTTSHSNPPETVTPTNTNPPETVTTSTPNSDHPETVSTTTSNSDPPVTQDSNTAKCGKFLLQIPLNPKLFSVCGKKNIIFLINHADVKIK